MLTLLSWLLNGKVKDRPFDGMRLLRLTRDSPSAFSVVAAIKQRMARKLPSIEEAAESEKEATDFSVAKTKKTKPNAGKRAKK